MKTLEEEVRLFRKWILLNLLSVLVGIAGGIGAIIFRNMILLNRIIFFNKILPLVTVEFLGINLGYILLPMLGGLIVGPLIMRLAPETKGHGVPEVMEAVALKGGRIRKRVAFLKILVSSVTIGSGGSAGREGPIAQIGASIGSLIGDVFKLSDEETRLLVVCGLSAGIAGTFNAPLGGALFGMEILYRGVELFNAVPVILAAVIGAAITTAYYGSQPSFKVPPTLTFKNPAELFWYFVLGVFFGLLSVGWVKFFYFIEELFEKMRFPRDFKMALGGMLTGFLGMFFPFYGNPGLQLVSSSPHLYRPYTLRVDHQTKHFF